MPSKAFKRLASEKRKKREAIRAKVEALAMTGQKVDAIAEALDLNRCRVESMLARAGFVRLMLSPAEHAMVRDARSQALRERLRVA